MVKKNVAESPIVMDELTLYVNEKGSKFYKIFVRQLFKGYVSLQQNNNNQRK